MSEREDIWAGAMRAARRGDTSAYESLLEDIGQALRVIIRGKLSRFGMGIDQTEDIIQEVLLGLHLMRDRWDEDRPFLPWLHAIVRYKVGDAVRKRSREARHRCDITIDDLAEIIAAPDQGDRHMPDMERALERLSAGQRDVVSSLAIEGQSIRQMAERLKTSEGAVRVTLHRALQRLAAFAESGADYARRGKT
jgi:RNA polymerase sigma-70 factor (ECF subfamily)